MALFGRRKRKKLINRQKGGVFNPTKTEVYYREYDDFIDAIYGELGVGSRDFKEIVFKFPDRDVTVLGYSDTLLNLLDPDFSFNLGNRSFWSEEFTEEEKVYLMEISSENDLLKYTELSDSVGDKKPEIMPYFRDAALLNLHRLSKEFNPKIRIKTEVIVDKERRQALKKLDFLNESSESLKEMVGGIDSANKEKEVYLGVDSLEYDEVTFGEISPIEESCDADRMVKSAIENNATLEDIKTISVGFDWSGDVLTSLADLRDRGLLKVVYPEQISLPDLPTLVDETEFVLPEEPITLPDDEEIEEVSEETVLEDSEEWKKEEIISMSNTEFRDALLQELTGLSEEEEELIIPLIQRNCEFEKFTEEIEEIIKPIKVEYFADREDYEDRKLQKTFKASDETKPERFSIEDMSDNLTMQSNLSGKFKELHHLERELLALNEERESIFKDLLSLGEEIEALGETEYSSLIQTRSDAIITLETIAFDYSLPEEIKVQEDLLDSYFDEVEETEEEASEDFTEFLKDFNSEEDAVEQRVDEIEEVEEEEETIDTSNALIYQRLAEKYDITL